jgi:hypothetical protein
VLLDSGNELSFADIFVISIKGDCFYELKIIPINITFLYLFTCLFFFSSALLLFGLVILKN